MPKIRNIRNKKDAHTLRIDKLLILRDLFIHKGWAIEEDESISFFNRYIQTLLSLEDSQQDFFLDISKRFIHLPQTLYLENLVKPLKKLREEDMHSSLLFACCLPEEDLGKVKSAHAVLYLFKGTTIKTKINLKPFSVIETWDTIVDTINLDKSRIVLVDDFVGTGNTAVSAINYIKKLFPTINPENISILSIVAMQEGIDLIQKEGCKTYCSIVCNKGISDYYSGEQLVEARSRMEAIESGILGLDEKFSFGFGHSESLVCMDRCPNNTFPIYWKKKNIAPYER